MKRLSHEDIIEGSLFGKTIAEAKELLTVVNQLIAEIKENGIQTKKTMDTMEGGAVKNTEQLRTLTSAYYQMTKAEELHTKLLTEQGTLQAKISNLEEQATANIVAQNHALKERAKALQDEITGINAAKAAQQQLNEQRKQEAEWAKSAVSIDTRPYERLRMQLAYVKKELKDLSVTGKENTATARALREEYERLDVTIRKAEESVGEYQRSVGNYGKSNRQFNFEMLQFQQILRELPNFAISARIGIMSLSNNLTQFQDAFKRMRQELGGTLPALRFFMKELLSFQTLMLLGISLAIQYSDQIGIFFKRMFGVTSVLDQLKIKMEEVNSEIKKAGESELVSNEKQITQIEYLVALINSETVSREDKKDAIEALNKISPEYLGNMNEENVKTEDGIKLINLYVQKLREKAEAQAYFARLVKTNELLFEAEFVRKQTFIDQADAENILGKDLTQAAIQAGQKRARKFNSFEGYAGEEVQQSIRAAILDYQLQLEAKKGLINQMLDGYLSSGVLPMGDPYIKDKKSGKDKTANLSRELGQDLAKAQVGGLEDGYVKEATKIMEDYKAKKEDLAAKYKGLEGDPRYSALMGALDDQKFAELQKLQDKYSKLMKDAYDAELERRAQINEQGYKQALTNIKQTEELRISEAQSAANELKKQASTAEEQKDIERQLQQDILQIKIKSLEDQIRIAEMAAKLGMVSINELRELQAELKKLKSELGIEKLKDPTQGDFNRQRQQIKAAIDGFNVIFEARERRQQNRLDKQIEATRRRQQELRDLANLGQRDAQQSLAAEERRLAELERKKEALQKRAARRQIATTALQAASNRLQAGDQNAIVNTINDMSRLMAAIYALPTFYDGTENVDKSISMFDLKTRKDPYVVRLHPGERVMTAKQNEMIGDMSNSELAQLAFRYRSGFSMVPVFTPGTDTSAQSILAKEIRDVKRAIEQKPESVTRWNDHEKAIEQKIVTGNKVRTIINKTGGVWRS